MPLLFHGFLAIHRHREGIETFHTFNDSPSLWKTRPIRHIIAATGANGIRWIQKQCGSVSAEPANGRDGPRAALSSSAFPERAVSPPYFLVVWTHARPNQRRDLRQNVFDIEGLFHNVSPQFMYLRFVCCQESIIRRANDDWQACGGGIVTQTRQHLPARFRFFYLDIEDEQCRMFALQHLGDIVSGGSQDRPISLVGKEFLHQLEEGNVIVYNGNRLSRHLLPLTDRIGVPGTFAACNAAPYTESRS
jgi:hypothetical protein